MPNTIKNQVGKRRQNYQQQQQGQKPTSNRANSTSTAFAGTGPVHVNQTVNVTTPPAKGRLGTAIIGGALAAAGVLKLGWLALRNRGESEPSMVWNIENQTNVGEQNINEQPAATPTPAQTQGASAGGTNTHTVESHTETVRIYTYTDRAFDADQWAEILAILNAATPEQAAEEIVRIDQNDGIVVIGDATFHLTPDQRADLIGIYVEVTGGHTAIGSGNQGQGQGDTGQGQEGGYTPGQGGAEVGNDQGQAAPGGYTPGQSGGTEVGNNQSQGTPGGYTPGQGSDSAGAGQGQAGGYTPGQGGGNELLNHGQGSQAGYTPGTDAAAPGQNPQGGYTPGQADGNEIFNFNPFEGTELEGDVFIPDYNKYPAGGIETYTSTGMPAEYTVADDQYYGMEIGE
ncbi:MAG: hypothetical protein FWE31_04580 [Firmicutes bacterium]|nr:hypothetical protein [Bacillota bacterium]